MGQWSVAFGCPRDGDVLPLSAQRHPNAALIIDVKMGMSDSEDEERMLSSPFPVSHLTVNYPGQGGHD